MRIKGIAAGVLNSRKMIKKKMGEKKKRKKRKYVKCVSGCR
jgi:hypothetical protein